MRIEESLNSEEHFQFLSFVFSVFGKSIDNIFLFLVEPSKNCVVARLICSTVVDCHIHWLNLCVQNIIENENDVWSSVLGGDAQAELPNAGGKIAIVYPFEG